MKEHPILFSAEMVKAILEDRKTQTRRVIKPQPIHDPDGSWRMEMHPRFGFNSEKTMRDMLPFHCPYGEPGDRLWVKETFGVHDKIISCPNDLPNIRNRGGIYHPVVHFAGKELYAWGMYGPPHRRSGRFMPKSATRIWLDIINVRVERVQEILKDDAKAEGISNLWEWNKTRYAEHPEHFVRGVLNPYVANYSVLWDEINAKRGFGWDVNPWVWVIEFKKVDHEIS